MIYIKRLTLTMNGSTKPPIFANKSSK